MTTPRLEVLISTHGENGLQRIASKTLPRVDDVGYVISCQYRDTEPGIPEVLSGRHDVRVVFTPTHGLSANRNRSLDIARAPYVLLADDDLDFNPDGLAAIIGLFGADPDLDILTLRHDSESPKVYPPDGHDLGRPFRNYYITSFEIALRLDAVRRARLRFCEQMGIGNDYITQGEEEVFVLDALAAGLKGRFHDRIVAAHTGPTSGLRNYHPGAMRARGVILSKTHPRTLFLRAAAIAWRLRNQATFFGSVKHILEGARFARRHNL